MKRMNESASRHCFLRLSAFVLAALAFSFTASLHAQFPGGGFGGFGGGGGQNQTRSSTSSGQYPNNGVGDAVFAIDPDTRKLVVIADEDTSKYISQVVSNLNRPKPQVLIKVVFLEVTRNDSLDIGIEGSYGKDIGNNGIPTGYITNYTTTLTTSVNGGVTNFTTSIVPTNLIPLIRGVNVGNGFGLANAGGPAGLYQIFSQDYTATVRAIATSGKAKVLSRPSIVARNNQPATITVGQSVPLITSVRFDNFGNAINSVTYQSVGIILRVTPFITGDGMVEMILSPETSELVQDRTQWVPISTGPSGSISAPLINSRSADTVVVTPDAQTVIIGGLMENAKAESETKIPFLGDIPLLGNLFKHKVTTTGKTELMIFLTPYIIHAPGEMAALSDKERAKSDAAKALTEQELNKFLDTIPSTNQPPKSVSKKRK